MRADQSGSVRKVGVREGEDNKSDIEDDRKNEVGQGDPE